MPNKMMDIWSSGAETLGAWLSMASSHSAEIAGRAGFDYICVDMQHGVADYQVAVTMMQAIELGGGTPIVRVPWNEPGIIGRALDAGARGVVIPMVNSVAEAQAAVTACKYPPLGARSFGPILVAARAEAGENYFEVANATTACIPMIETRQAVEALDDILSIDGVDAIYVGPADLSISYGYGPGYTDDHADYKATLEHIAERCAAHGVVAGIHSTSALSADRRGKGFRMQTVSGDAAALGRGMVRDLRTARESGIGAADSGADAKIY